MSNATPNAYNLPSVLTTNAGATAAAVDIITKACGAGDDTSKIQVLDWAAKGNNLIALRNKIKAAAGE